MQLFLTINIILIRTWMADCLLSLEDINEFIKHFALRIRHRIQDIYTDTQISLSNQPLSSNKQPQSITYILNKYAAYSSQHPLEIKIIKKFVERIIQIFHFFKINYHSNRSQNLLELILNQIKLKLEFYLLNPIVPIGQIIHFAHTLTYKDTLISILKHNFFHSKKKSSQKTNFLRTCSTSVKINTHFEPQQQVFQRVQNKTNMSIIQVAKTNYNFEPLKKKYSFSKDQKINQIRQRPSTSKQNRIKENRSESQDNTTQCLKSYSVSKKKRGTYLRVILKQNKDKDEEKVKNVVQLDKLYVDMNLDKKFIDKMLERKQFIFKDMQRRNQKILQNIRKQAKRQKLATEQYEASPETSYEKQSEKIQLKLLTEQNNNIQLDRIIKKQSLRNMAYQNYLDRKKKAVVKNNSRISKKGLIQDKQNIFVDEK